MRVCGGGGGSVCRKLSGSFLNQILWRGSVGRGREGQQLWAGRFAPAARMKVYLIGSWMVQISVLGLKHYMGLLEQLLRHPPGEIVEQQ